jgi:hypothetical protein
MTYNSPRVYNMNVFDIEPRYKETNNTTMTLSEILKQFEELCNRDSTGLCLYEEQKLLLESFLTKTYTSMVEAEIARLEGEKKIETKHERCTLDDNWCYTHSENMQDTDLPNGAYNYNQAIEDQINYWKNKLK